MKQFTKNIKDIFFKHINVDIYANSSRLVIEMNKVEVFSYYPKKDKLNISDPLTIVTGLQIKKLFDIRIGDKNETKK